MDQETRNAIKNRIEELSFNDANGRQYDRRDLEELDDEDLRALVWDVEVMYDQEHMFGHPEDHKEPANVDSLPIDEDDFTCPKCGMPAIKTSDAPWEIYMGDKDFLGYDLYCNNETCGEIFDYDDTPEYKQNQAVKVDAYHEQEKAELLLKFEYDEGENIFEWSYYGFQIKYDVARDKFTMWHSESEDEIDNLSFTTIKGFINDLTPIPIEAPK